MDNEPVQWTVEVTGYGDSLCTRFYDRDKYWKFVEGIGTAWDDLGLQSYVDYYSIEHKGYVSWDDLDEQDFEWLKEFGITEEENY